MADLRTNAILMLAGIITIAIVAGAALGLTGIMP